MTTDLLQAIGLIVAGWMIVSAVLALFLFLLVIRQIKHIDVPVGAGFSQTLQHTPFVVVLFIDLLDWGLDFMAAPLAWVILDRLGLKALRGVSAVEALIPFTQFIPTMMLCWLGVRLGLNLDLRRSSKPQPVAFNRKLTG